MEASSFETVIAAQLETVHGGIDPAAQWVMQHESGGSTTAGFLTAQGRGDGTPGNHSSAFGAFQLTRANRIKYMGKDFESTSFDKQYAGASHYVQDRYGSWGRAKAFWQGHRWY